MLAVGLQPVSPRTKPGHGALDQERCDCNGTGFEL
jgi:hypothetical protein